MTREALEVWLCGRGETVTKAKAHAAVIFEQVYQHDLRDLSELPLPCPVRDAVAENFGCALPETETALTDGGAVKLLLKLSDGEFAEAVLMRQKYGDSVCISTQVGCAMGCRFCQSGRLKKRRNLTAGEMTAQVMLLRRDYSAKIHSVTVMGIGEPFDNFEAVRDFCAIAVDYKGLALGEKHVTVSTCGVVPGIGRWAELPHPCSLAISLHAADNALRERLMPINKLYPVQEVIAAARAFAERHNRRVTLEYIMLNGVNDSPEQAEKLAVLIGTGKQFYVNLIPYNSTDGGFERSSPERIAAFYDVLKKHEISVTMRREFGGNIAAACGQLSSQRSL